LKSTDTGRTWTAPEEIQVALGALPEAANAARGQQITLAKLIRDLHTGEALLGHDADWLWSDIVGATMTFLACTGVYMARAAQGRVWTAEAPRRSGCSRAGRGAGVRGLRRITQKRAIWLPRLLDSAQNDVKHETILARTSTPKSRPAPILERSRP
jgi:hypothetical protein